MPPPAPDLPTSGLPETDLPATGPTWHFVGSPLGRPLVDTDFSCYTNSLREMRKGAVKWLADGTARQWSYTDGRITEAADDILLGLATVDTTRAGRLPDWVAANRITPDAAAHPNTYILQASPPHDTFPAEKQVMTPYLDRQLRAARLVFAAVGTYWFARWRRLDDGSAYADVRDRIVRINCGCDAGLLPFKHRTTRRQLLHVSNMAWCKNPELLAASMDGIDSLLHVGSTTAGIERHYASRTDGTPIRSVYGIGPFRNSEDEFNAFVLSRCDFYLHTSRLDAQATAILENCARGLVPIITPESGFHSDHAVYITQDPARNRPIIERALAMPEAEYRERSEGVRQQVLRHHGWRPIFERITDIIRRDRRGEPVAGDAGPPLS